MELWSIKPRWAQAKVWPKMSQARLADAKARVAPSKPSLAPSQPPLGTSQSWGGSGQSLAWSSPSQCATHAKTTRAWLPHGPIPPRGGIGGRWSDRPSAWGRPSGTWLCAKIRAPPNLAYQAPWAHSQALVALGHAGLVIVPSGTWYTIPLSEFEEKKATGSYIDERVSQIGFCLKEFGVDRSPKIIRRLAWRRERRS
jgi:hypothetical protein